jgi:hypothetical protein
MKKLLALLFLFLAAPSAAQEVVFFGWYSAAPFTCDGQTQYASYGDTTLVALRVCNGTSWKTLTTGSGTTNTVPKFTPDGVTLGNSTITDDGTVVTVNGSGKFTGASAFIDFPELAAPATPAAGFVRLYANNSATAEFCSKDDGGTETCMSAGSGGSGISYAEAAAAVLAGF